MCVLVCVCKCVCLYHVDVCMILCGYVEGDVWVYRLWRLDQQIMMDGVSAGCWSILVQSGVVCHGGAVCHGVVRGRYDVVSAAWWEFDVVVWC